MISTDHKFLFLRVPKSAGKSIDVALKRYYMPLPAVFRTKDKNEREEKSFSQHLSYRDCLYHIDQQGLRQSQTEAATNRDCLHHFVPLDISTFFKFAFVRNPWCRIASYYLSKQSRSARYMDKFIPSIKKKFCNWIKELGQKDNSWYMKKPERGFEHMAGTYPILGCQQIQYLTEDMSTEGRIAVDFVGRFESLRKDLDHIEEQIGIKINLPKRNLGKARGKKHYSLYYKEESVAMIRDIFAKDIEYFGYEFEDRT